MKSENIRASRICIKNGTLAVLLHFHLILVTFGNPGVLSVILYPSDHNPNGRTRSYVIRLKERRIERY